MKNDAKSILSNNDGQSFIEFLLLFLILVTISFSILSGFNRSIGRQWSAIVKAVTLPNSTNSFNL